MPIINPLAPAEFSPTWKGFSGQGAFRYWAQTVLPAVYDDSLSYQELLAKVVQVVNVAIEDVDAVEDNVDALRDVFEELQDYTNSYFDDLNIQEEVNRGLDKLVEDGVLTAAMEPYLTRYREQVETLTNTVDTTNTNLNARYVETNERISNIISANNSSTENSELVDIRNDNYAKTYASAGAAVRGQVKDIHTLIKNIGKYEDGRVIIPCEDLTVPYGANMSIDKRQNLIKINGTSQTERIRLCIYGTCATTGTRITYSNTPQWYHDACDSFIIGHKYKAIIKLISGSVDDNESTIVPYLEMRNTENSIQTTLADEAEWVCNYQPNIAAFVFSGYKIYTNAEYFVTFLDTTTNPDINNINSEISNIEQDIKTINNEVFKYEVPNYFIDQVTTAISKIITDMNDGKTTAQSGNDIEAFVFITDVHWRGNKQHSPALIKKIVENTPVRTVICGGDLIEGHNSTKEGAIQEILGFTNAITNIPNIEYYCVYGNHDSNTNSNIDISITFTKDEEYGLMYPFKNQKNVHFAIEDGYDGPTQSVLKNDYYFDHVRTKTRFICIDWQNPFDNPRQRWLADTLAKDDGYRVVIIYHGIYAYNETAENNLVTEHIQIMNHLAPYKNKIVGLFTGHAHIDRVMDYWGDNTTPVVITACDKFKTGRTEGTNNEQCFDVVVIDYQNSVIKTTRIGDGENRTIEFSLM